MKFQFFTISTHDFECAQKELNSFCASHRIASLEKRFADNGADSFWSFCISYIESGTQTATKQEKIDYREKLDEKDFSVFAKLRILRKSLAEKEGLPAYALFTNEQLSRMVVDRVTSLAAMQKISGIGKARIEKYGAQFLEILVAEFAAAKETENGKTAK